MTIKLISVAGLLLIHFICINADVYMHAPRGSNNRLNEKSANRRNGNRAFDSQNNNRGGYNAGDRTTNAANSEATQYQMVYFQSSPTGKTHLPIEWTNQHGCGGNEDDNPNKLNCIMTFQFMCQPDDPNDIYRMKDGTNTNTPNYQNPGGNERKQDFDNRKRNTVRRNDRVYQEPIEWYDKCTQRERNKGLFTADQRVGNQAKNTRQNPGGTRRGLECPEERDYYPYWHPSDWKDIGVLAENASMCNWYQTESFNVKPKHECVENFRDSNIPKHYSKHNNEAACTAAGGTWQAFHSFLEKDTATTTEAACTAKGNIWGVPIYGGRTKECLVPLKAPWCKQSPFSRVNHLGNGADLEPLAVDWELPHFPSGKRQRCVLRMRYNISTDDYDPYFTTSAQNNNPRAGIKSPVTQNPTVNIGADNVGLKLAINTAQFGRTFQDRSHIFFLEPRTTALGNSEIHNLNVRGKRGNIVQTYPAVEYDFYPTNLEMKEDALVHIQWTGSNTHNNGNPAGDGQAGDDGQGRGGTDRNNILGLNDRDQNYPLTMEDPRSIFNNVKSIKWQGVGNGHLMQGGMNDAKKKDIAVQMASSGYYQCISSSNCGGNSLERKNKMNKLLDNASPSFPGMVLQFNSGEYNYQCTRNNNFSNRSQKATLKVTK